MSGFVYVIQSGPDGPIKIGFSDNPDKRLEQLKGANPTELRLVTKFPATRHEEEQLHAKATELGLHVRGEWFAPDTRLAAAIEETRWDGAARLLAMRTRDAVYQTIEAAAHILIQGMDVAEALDEETVRSAFLEAASSFMDAMAAFRVEGMSFAKDAVAAGYRCEDVLA